jgi:cell division protein FtsW
MKLAFVIYAAALFSSAKERIQNFSSGPLPLLTLLAAGGLLLLLQPDTDTFVVLFLAILSMFVVAGGRIRHMCIIGLVVLLGLGALILSRPYLKERVLTFINPARDLQGAGWQINQSLIAIGSGGMWGRGFGQSVQKFSYLPEPIGDSIFAVAAEEFGFVGSVSLIARPSGCIAFARSV